MKQKISLFLALCILGGLLAGCGQRGDPPGAADASGSGDPGGISSGSGSGGGSAAGSQGDASQGGSSQPDTAPEGTTPPETAGTEETNTVTHEGVDYVTITMSGYLGSGQNEFDLGDGQVHNWYYHDVALGSTCTITPVASDAYKYISLLLTTYEVEDGVYSLVPWGIRHRLYADGQVEDGVIWGELDELPLPTPDHPAYFTFGENPDAKSPFGGDPPMGDPFEFKADGTMYQMDVEFYDESGEYVYGFFDIFFVK